LAAAAVYALMPGIQLASGVVTTDAPLLFFLALLIWGLAALPDVPAPRRLAMAAGLGAVLGLGLLSKYAAVYAAGGLVLHLALSRDARRPWTPAMLAVFAVALAVVFAPNVIWNAHHHFATLEHTAGNANWGAKTLFNPRELGEFLLSQFGVFGPLPFAVLIGGGVVLAVRRRLTAPDVMLLCFVVPPLLTVAAQAFVSRANANWAGAAYVAGSVLVGAWMLRWGARRWLIAGLTLQAILAAVFLAWVINPRTAESMGVANSFKRARGWKASVEAIVDRARSERVRGTVTAVAVDDRFLFNAAAYYGRDYFGQPGTPSLRMWVHEARPQNQAETEAPLTAVLGQRALVASLEGGYRPEIEQDFARTFGLEIVRIGLDRKHSRRTDLFVAEGFAPLPRDPVTGLPPKPKAKP
jgi:4-amino-4-deoxy-L-arabinose transferase-like glycosyltransferase